MIGCFGTVLLLLSWSTGSLPRRPAAVESSGWLSSRQLKELWARAVPRETCWRSGAATRYD